MADHQAAGGEPSLDSTSCTIDTRFARTDVQGSEDAPSAPLTERLSWSNSQSSGARPLPHIRPFQLRVLAGSRPRGGDTWESQRHRTALGAHPDNDFVICDAAVSRFHCEIDATEHGYRLRDVGSLNGTMVDGVRVLDAFLRHGTRIRLGNTVLEFSVFPGEPGLPLSPCTRFGTLMGVSAAMRSAFAILERAAQRDVTILIEGETGTGKTQAARAVHQNSSRRERPFVVVDCGTILGSLLESELFGHEKGAFTGALSRRIGAFEEAHGGTIFLDEVGELPLELQPKLLRVLEARTFRRLGSNQHVTTDVRVIAATNRDLRADIANGRFREDLYFRLGVVTVGLPSLRERPEDFPALVDDLLECLGASPDEERTLTAPDFIAQLARSAWPGNVRELRNFLERCLVLGRALAPEGASPEIERKSAPHSVDATAPYNVERERAIARFERRFFEQLLEICDGRVARVAETCGLDRRYVYRILKRHGLRVIAD